jgi:uncharacterized protein (TIGR00251 family)
LAQPGIVDLIIQPRSSKSEVVGLYGEAIKIRVKAPPVDGAANDELLRFLAKRLGVPRSAVRLVTGTASRRKRVAVDGRSATAIRRSLLGTG